MYPSSQYGINFGANDLPNEIKLNGSVLTKNGGSYGDTTNGIFHQNGLWVVYQSENQTTRSCLISGDGNFTPNDDLVEDTFLYTYEVTYVEGSITAIITVSRIGICSWFGFADIGGGTIRVLSLVYNDTALRGSSNQYKWTLDTQFSLRTKSGFQNTPIGSYTAAGDSTWTVA